MITDQRYRPSVRPQQTRTACPSCGAAITPEQDTQIREQDRQRQESIIEKIKEQDGKNTQPGKQKPFPIDGLWDKKREEENQLTPPQLGTPGSPEAEARLKWEKENNWNPERKLHTGSPVNDLFQRKQQETGFYQGPSAAEQKKGAVWGAQKKPMVGQNQGQQTRDIWSTGNSSGWTDKDGKRHRSYHPMGQNQKLPNFGAVGNEGNAFTRDRRKSVQGVMGKMY